MPALHAGQAPRLTSELSINIPVLHHGGGGSQSRLHFGLDLGGVPDLDLGLHGFVQLLDRDGLAGGVAVLVGGGLDDATGGNIAGHQLIGLVAPHELEGGAELGADVEGLRVVVAGDSVVGDGGGGGGGVAHMLCGVCWVGWCRFDEIRISGWGGGSQSLVFGGVGIPAVSRGLGLLQGFAGVGNVVVLRFVDDPSTCIWVRPDGVGAVEGGDGTDDVRHIGCWVVGCWYSSLLLGGGGGSRVRPSFANLVPQTHGLHGSLNVITEAGNGHGLKVRIPLLMRFALILVAVVSGDESILAFLRHLTHVTGDAEGRPHDAELSFGGVGVGVFHVIVLWIVGGGREIGHRREWVNSYQMPLCLNE